MRTRRSPRIDYDPIHVRPVWLGFFPYRWFRSQPSSSMCVCVCALQSRTYTYVTAPLLGIGGTWGKCLRLFNELVARKCEGIKIDIVKQTVVCTVKWEYERETMTIENNRKERLIKKWQHGETWLKSNYMLHNSVFNRNILSFIYRLHIIFISFFTICCKFIMYTNFISC